MSFIIDRRLNGKNKNAINRKRFLDRYKHRVQEAVNDAVKRRSITDMERGEDVVIPANDISEPVFQHGTGGRRSVVHPGNREFLSGDRIPRPGGGAGSGAGEGDASNEGQGEDDFVFTLSEAEFMDYLFEDLELPNLAKQHLKGNDSFTYEHAGYTTSGTPAKLCVVRSLKAAKARRRALTGPTRRRLDEVLSLLAEAEATGDELAVRRLGEEREMLERRLRRVPFLDDRDLRYNLHLKRPVPTSQAVMFCLMDVSGSMGEETKALAKRFYLLLYMFLKRNYERTDVVFIRHHTVAKEVTEDEFFHSRETGGTVVSSALKLMLEVIEARYSPSVWNIYGAQASDGDNWNDDSPICGRLLRERILPLVQHFSYVEITQRSHQALWREYEQLVRNHGGVFALKHVRSAADIFPVFHELFQRRGET
ncbi:MAG: YeaH/YhbH family protein [Gammaproteobacteria bacterium]|jgi:uncharacterized sporulation protein YeaH/YhbH (DUF444 family)